jgi:antitoxin component YwqK of YwqJK toxin-antitoxin module
MHRLLLILLAAHSAIPTINAQADTISIRDSSHTHALVSYEKKGYEILEARKNGLPDGLTVVLKNQKILSVKTYKDGAEDGYRYDFDNDGKLTSITFYQNGNCTYYLLLYPNGLKKHELVDNQSECYTKFWDEKWTLLATGTCVE